LIQLVTVFIRKIVSRKSTCFQIGQKRYGKFVLIKHVGCASIPNQIEVLRVKAKQLLNQYKFKYQMAMFPDSPTFSSKAKLQHWRITGYHQVFGVVYDSIGFPSTLLRDLVIGRIVCPKSKVAMIRYLNRYLGLNLTKDQVYRFMDTLDKEALTRCAFDFVSKQHPTGITVCFYDVTTLYFETETEDSLRSKGFSKDHRADMPQILIGLFVDDKGYPFDFDFFEGKTFEGHTFPIAITKLRQKYALTQLTVVADAGMLSADNLAFLDGRKISYIVGARIKNLSNVVTVGMLKHNYVQQPIYQTVVNNQRLIVEYSEKRAGKAEADRKRLVTKLQQKLIKKKLLIHKSKYVKVDGKQTIMGLDYQKIKADQKFDGLKGYFTNQNNLNSNLEIIEQYHNLWKVEKAFRMSKTDLRERPVYHQQVARIQTHLLICFVSLLVMKEAELKLAKIGYSIKQAIEMLASVGQGNVRVGNMDLDTESDNDTETQSILNIFKGH